MQDLNEKTLKQLVSDCLKAINGQCRLEDKDYMTDSDKAIYSNLLKREEELREEFLIRVYNLTDIDAIEDGLTSEDINSDAFCRMEKRFNVDFGVSLWVMGDGSWS